MGKGHKLDIKMIMVIGWVLRYRSFFILSLAHDNIFIFSLKRCKLLLFSGTGNTHMTTTVIKQFSSVAQGSKEKMKTPQDKKGFWREPDFQRNVIGESAIQALVGALGYVLDQGGEKHVTVET